MSGVKGKSGVYERERRPNFKEKVCPMCGQIYKPTSSYQIYCGSERKKIGCAFKRVNIRAKEKQMQNRDKYLLNLKTHHLYNKYRIRLEDKEKMRVEQGNKCLICGSEFIDITSANVDHCHRTNKIRGLLCGSCNRGLGMFKDNIELLKSAIKYLGGVR